MHGLSMMGFAKKCAIVMLFILDLLLLSSCDDHHQNNQMQKSSHMRVIEAPSTAPDASTTKGSVPASTIPEIPAKNHYNLNTPEARYPLPSIPDEPDNIPKEK